MGRVRCLKSVLCLAAGLAVLVMGCAVWAEDPARSAPSATEAAALEFFERSVRPILVERCQGCHGAQKQKNGLRLDAREAVLKGGITGPAIVPGKPEASLLVDAVRYGELYQMPPKSKLPDAEIATLTRWVALGAPWPAASSSHADLARNGEAFDLKARARHWSFQPLRNPAVPEVHDTSWPRTDIDRFLLARLEQAGLSPAPDADQRTLIRRLTFDLIGLPPTPDEVHAFVADESPDAYARLVERLLASPHYGERSGRFWLDLVRFAETAGHEFDYDILGAYRYRDYVIRAFNADLPYRDFVVEHLAGDLLAQPRRHPTEGFNESIIATGFYFLGEGTHSPVDLLDDEALRIDNQLDVLSKTFLGLTVACARCHDHKFDAISTRDYYALAGYLQSSRFQHAFIDPPERIAAYVQRLERTRQELETTTRDWINRANSPGPGQEIAAYLLAARAVLLDSDEGHDRIAAAARAAGVDAPVLKRWVDALRTEDARSPGHPLSAWAALLKDETQRESLRNQSGVASANASPSVLFEDFEKPTYEGWFVSGDAFGSGPTRAGELRVGGSSERPALTLIAPGQAHSGRSSDRLQGVLRSRTFVLDHKFIHYLASGRAGRINLVIDGFEKIRDPIYGGLAVVVNHSERARWHVQDVSMWLGHRAYIEIADGAVSLYAGARSQYAPGDGFIAVDEIRFSDESTPATSPDAWAALLLEEVDPHSPEQLAARFAHLVTHTLKEWAAGRLEVSSKNRARVAAVGWLLERGLIGPEPVDELTRQLASYRAIEAEIPAPTLAPAIADGTGEDERVHLRGSSRSLGSIVPRRFLEAIAGSSQPAPSQGSGRLELAQRLIDPANPLPARVIVNRIWQHHFGQGLVPTPDDFGVMGQPPTHPELIDWLASQFIAQGWSIKQLHRLIVSSHAYQMASMAERASEGVDPSNRLLHRMSVRRLEAEAIRDAMLAVSGRLDRTMFGASVPVHLTLFMEGRGRPAASGPLDGNGRRSIYINVRRNFLTPMFLAFDFPVPATTMGKRNVSNVPAQALTLLNDPFVIEQARLWADRVLAEPRRSDSERLSLLYETAFARPPTAGEVRQAMEFLATQMHAYGQAGEPRAWADLCHVLLNAKEFLFIP